MNKEKISGIYKLFAVVLGLTALIYRIINSEQPHVLFYFFTVLMNVLCIIVFLVLVINKKLKLYELRGAMTTGIILVMLVFHFMLRPSSAYYAEEIGYFDLVFHYILPVMVLFDFCFFTEPKRLNWYQPFLWTGLPITYLVFVFLRAAIGNAFETGYGLSKYPYFFLDVDALGVKTVVIWIVAILTFYIILGYLVLGLDMLLKNVSAKRRNI